ncbi:MAG: hypothetical protein ACRDRK_27625 [Pseudonocardia sp.]
MVDVMVRDMIGRVSLVLDDRHQELADGSAEEIAARLSLSFNLSAPSFPCLRLF